MRNRGLKFVCRDVHIRTENDDTPFTKNCYKNQVLRIPVAHHDGNYFIDADTKKAMNDHGQIVFRYASESGEVTDAANPNGALDNIAGIINAKKNVLGMMPHPERLFEPALGGTDGKFIFDSIINTLR
jgi:phosphoribosylformylglycinamidine synthase